MEIVGSDELVWTLIDTGALQNDFISSKLIKRFNLSVLPSETLVCTGLKRQCHRAIGTTSIRVWFCNELTNSAEEITIYPIVVDHDIDIIIGKPTIFENNLL